MNLHDVSYDEFKYIQKQLLATQPYIKNYGDKFYKLIVLKRVIEYSQRTFTKKGEANNNTKLENNLIRAKSRVFELSVCNDFDYFVTLTLDPKKYDRYNLKKYIKDLSQFIRNQNRIKNYEIKYLFVPEMHEDGAWHLHGFIKGLPLSEIQPTGYKDKNGDDYIHWVGYSKKFGYMSMSKIEDSLRASFYMRKYITKTMAENNMNLGAHTYYASKGLLGANDSVPLDYNAVNDELSWRLKFSSDFVDVYSLTKEDGMELLEKYAMGDESILFENQTT